MRLHVTTEDAELSDLLDRILDRGLVLEAAFRMLLSHINVAEALKTALLSYEDTESPEMINVVPRRSS